MRNQRKKRLFQQRGHRDANPSGLSASHCIRAAHEMRTPVNVIGNLIFILLKDENLSEHAVNELEKIHVSVQYLKGLIHNILDMSKLESGKMEFRNELINFSDFLKGIFAMTESQAVEKHVRLEMHTRGLEDVYIGDKVKLQQLLLNLLSNAVKYTPEGGMVQLGVVQEVTENGRAKLRFTVKDNGIGMSEEFLPVMFEPFTQDPAASVNFGGGAGLGLAICKNIVTLMGGTIDVVSQKGKGSEFVVKLSLAVPSDSTASRFLTGKAAGRIEYDFSQKRVLLVDDKPANVEVARLLLEFCGASVDTAVDGQEALKRFMSAPAGYFDAILLDMSMPVMDGWTAAAHIRRCGKEDSRTVPIIAMTANAFGEDVEKARSCGMNGHLAKPIHAQQLYGILNLIFSGEKTH